MKVTHRFEYYLDGLSLESAYLVGSWDDQGNFEKSWPGTPILMQLCEEDGWASTYFTAEITLSAEAEQEFYWGVKDKDDEWLFFEERARLFKLCDNSSTHRFRLGNRFYYGLHLLNEAHLRARVWAPNALRCQLVLDAHCSTEISFPMNRDEDDFVLELEEVNTENLVGRPYAFEFFTASGQTVRRADPYARVRQGPQRGVEQLFFSPEGKPRHRYSVEKRGLSVLAFESQDEISGVLRLEFRDSAGRRVTKSQLENRLRKEPIKGWEEQWWSNFTDEQGRITVPLHPGEAARRILVGPEKALRGWRYLLIDDAHRSFHDRWSNLLEGLHAWPRFGLICQEEPLESLEPVGCLGNDLRFYELHVGSVLGSKWNTRRSTVEDVAGHLNTFQELGFNSLALMPTNSTEGWRDWGYLGTSSMAHHESYTENNEGARQAIKRFVRGCHSSKLFVFNDVVYNHVGGHHNDWWNFDGEENPYFDRRYHPDVSTSLLREAPTDSEVQTTVCLSKGVRETPWGPIPAFNKPTVRGFFIDHCGRPGRRAGL